MARFSIFNTPNHHKFEYKPRYWDPKKENTEAFKERIEKIQSNNVEGTKARITSNLRTGYGGDQRLRTQLVRRSNIRIMGIVGFLVLLTYFLVNRYMDDFFKWLA